MEKKTAIIRAELEQMLHKDPEKLVQIALQQAVMIQALEGTIKRMGETIAALEIKVAQLEKRLAEAEGRNHPPAAPFRRTEKERSKMPGRAGRAKGHEGSFRSRPEQIDQKVDVSLAQVCPECGGRLGECKKHVQYIEEIPPVRPHVTELCTWSGRCESCGKHVKSTHPLQVSGAHGSAGVHLGARAQAFACALKHSMGLPIRKVAAILRDMCGLNVSAGALAQMYQRVAGKAQVHGQYDSIRQELVEGQVVHTDETSWWLGGKPSGLWVWCSKVQTLYRVVEKRDRETFHQVLPPDWPGVLVSDCLSVYDGATPVQQKCYSHHHKAIRKGIQAGAAESEGSYLWQCRNLLRSAMELKKRKEELDKEEYQQRRRTLDIAARILLEKPRENQPEEERVRLRLQKQIDHLFTFLDHKEVDATNNLAERQLRPAVIARKLSCGNKTRKGADAWQIMASLAATSSQQGRSFIDFLLPLLAFQPR